MTKEEKARSIVEQDGECRGVSCSHGEVDECPCYSVCKGGVDKDPSKIAICQSLLDGYSQQPSKTLLDEFAMAALTGALSNPEVMLDIAEEDLKSLAKAYATCSYEYAAAMMKERERRDEMGNVKEVE